jgi:hypothetical protein
MTPHAPHRTVQARTPQERFLVSLFDALWAGYRARMPYVKEYERLLEEHQATFVNDHVAFRTLASPSTGIATVARLFEALGYSAAGCYEFPDKHLASRHYRHPNPGLPKVFISELRLWELSSPTRRRIARALESHRAPIADEMLARLARAPASPRLLREAVRFFTELPWKLPEKRDVMAVNEESQFGAWTLVNGYGVNHFTALVDSHGVPALSDIEKTVVAMKQAGIPMKPEIEGAPGSSLRQSSTLAVMDDIRVRQGRRTVTLPWTYAYFEIAERPLQVDATTGERRRFEGFLGGQATHLFEMTQVRKDR